VGDGVFFVGRGDLLAAIADVCVLAALRGVEAREAPGAGHVAGLADGAVGVLGLERSHGRPVFRRVRALCGHRRGRDDAEDKEQLKL